MQHLNLKEIVVCTTSQLKMHAVNDVVLLFPYLEDVKIRSVDSQPTDNPVQPINSGQRCASNRISFLQKKAEENPGVGYLAIESDYEEVHSETGKEYQDVAHVVFTFGDTTVYTRSIPVPIDADYVAKAFKRSEPEYANKNDGLSVTVGEIIHEEFPDIPANDWMSAERFGGHSRTEQIKPAIEAALKKYFITQILAYYEDFPKKGVRFADLSPALANPLGFKYIAETMRQALEAKGWANKVTRVVGFDARGFILGAIVARDLNVGFIPFRKKGKLPGKTYSITYKTEYSEDTLEIPLGTIEENDKLLLVDDVIATGGTFKAGIDLVAMCGVKGASVLGCFTLRQVDFLVEDAKKKLAPVEFLSVI